jgi:hypothetical protein
MQESSKVCRQRLSFETSHSTSECEVCILQPNQMVQESCPLSIIGFKNRFDYLLRVMNVTLPHLEPPIN